MQACTLLRVAKHCRPLAVHLYRVGRGSLRAIACIAPHSQRNIAVAGHLSRTYLPNTNRTCASHRRHVCLPSTVPKRKENMHEVTLHAA